MANPTNGTYSADLLAGTSSNDRLLGHAGDDIFDFTGPVAQMLLMAREGWIPPSSAGVPGLPDFDEQHRQYQNNGGRKR
jgi:Ca2+-binding RTX toxin-like protein